MPCSIILSNQFFAWHKIATKHAMKRRVIYNRRVLKKRGYFLDFTSASFFTVTYCRDSVLAVLHSDCWPNHASSFSCSFVSLDSSSLAFSLQDSFDTVN